MTEKETRQVRTTISMLSSMVSCGDDHSKQSIDSIEESMKYLDEDLSLRANLRSMQESGLCRYCHEKADLCKCE